MIERVDRRLRAWVCEVLGELPVSLAPPGDAGPAGIGLYLVELRSRPPHRGPQPAPHQLALRYLVTAWAEEPEEAHRLLGELAFAAFDDPELTVDLTPPPPTLWTALGTAPRPSFTLEVVAVRERPERPVRRVLQPLVLELAPVTPLEGQVVGPGGVPLAAARVEIPTLGLSTRTDPDGRFRFDGVPADGRALALTIAARGRRISFNAEDPAGEPLLVSFNPWED